jgi:hypothetical protein
MRLTFSMIKYRQIYLPTVSIIFQLLLFMPASRCQTPLQSRLELARLRLEKNFTSVDDFDTVSLLAVSNKDYHFAYIDTLGKPLTIAIEGKFQCYYSFRNGLAFVCTIKDDTRTYYIIDRNGKPLEKLPVQDIRGDRNLDRIIASDKTGKHGIINRKGKIIVPFTYYLLEPLDSIFVRAFVGEQFNWKVGIIDNNGKIIIPPVYHHIYYYDKTTGYLLVNQGKDLVAIDGQHEYRVKDAYPKIYAEPSRMHIDFINGLILDKIELSKTILYDLQLNRIDQINKKYDAVDFLSDGLIGVRNWRNKQYDSTGRMVTATGSLFGIVNKQGEIIVPLIYDHGYPFQEGLCRVSMVKDKRGYYGFVNKQGRLVIPCIYENSSDFHYGYAKVQKGDNFFIIDKEGNYVMPAKSFYDR